MAAVDKYIVQQGILNNFGNGRFTVIKKFPAYKEAFDYYNIIKVRTNPHQMSNSNMLVTYLSYIESNEKLNILNSHIIKK